MKNWTNVTKNITTPKDADDRSQAIGQRAVSSGGGRDFPVKRTEVLVVTFRAEKKLKPRPQSKILIPLRGSFQHFSRSPCLFYIGGIPPHLENWFSWIYNVKTIVIFIYLTCLAGGFCVKAEFENLLQIFISVRLLIPETTKNAKHQTTLIFLLQYVLIFAWPE